MKLKSMIWAVDPFENLERQKVQVSQFIQGLAGRGPISVKPVYVVTPDLSQAMADSGEGPWFQDPTPDPRKALEKASTENKVRDAIARGMSTVDAFKTFGVM